MQDLSIFLFDIVSRIMWSCKLYAHQVIVYGAPIVSLFCMLNICSIHVEYSFYISNICSVFQMFVPYFKYLFHISNIYSQFEIFVPYPKNLCNISNICSVLTLFSMDSFKNTTVCNFGVSYGRRTKFGNMGNFHVLSSKMAFIFKFRASMTSL